MIVKKDNKEVKNAKVFYSMGAVAYVQVDGVNYDAKSFELVEDDQPVKKTTDVSKSDKAAVKTADVKSTEEDSAVLTTKDVSTRKK